MDFGTELRRLLSESKTVPSLRELAKQVHIDPGHLSRLMSGKRPPGLDLAKRCDKILGSGTKLTDIVADAERRAASRSTALATPGDPLTVCVPVVVNGRTQLVPLDRRSFLKGVAGSAVALAGGAGPAAVGSRHLAPEIAEHLVDVRAMLVRSDSMMGPGRLIATVSEQLANVQEMLPMARGGLRTRMFEVASLFAELQGWLQDDIGSTVTGSAWTSRALEWAEASGNDSLAAYMLMRRAQQAIGQGNSDLAVGLAAAAQRRAAGSARIRAAAAQQEAQGYAADRDERAALDALDRALDVVTGLDEPVGEYELASWCTPDYVHAQRGAALMRMGRYGQAVQAFDDALAQWPSEYRRERGLHLARKAHALAAGQVTDDALDAGTAALQIAADTGSRRTLDELALAARVLRVGGDGVAVVEFSQAVDSALREGLAS